MEEKEVIFKNNRSNYYKVQNSIKNAKLEKYSREQQEIEKEGLTFLGFFNRRNNLQLEKLKNIKLRTELLHFTRIIAKDDVTDKELLADLYSCAIKDLQGKITPEMMDVYNEIKSGIKLEIGEDLDTEVYEMACEKIYNSKDLLPVVYEESNALMFSARRAQIKSLRIENQNLENQIYENRNNEIIIPLKNKIFKS